MNNKIKKGVLNAWLWDISGTYLLKLITLIVSIILARILPPADFGIIGIVMSLNSFAQVFVDFGFSSAIIQNKSLNNTKLSTVFFINLAISSLFALLLFFGAAPIANFFEEVRLLEIIQVMSVIFVINGFNAVQISLYRKKLQFKLLTKSYVVAAIFSGIVGVSMAYSGFGIWSLVGQVLSKSFVLSAMIWYQSSWKPQFIFSFDSVRELWKYGSNIFGAAVLDGLFSRLDVLLIGKLFNMTELGFFTRAKSFKNITIQMVTGSLSKVLFPTFSQIQDDVLRLRRIYLELIKLIIGATVIVCGLLFLIAEDMYVILITEKWLPSVPLFQVLIFGAVIFPLSSAMVNVVKGMGNASLFLKMAIVKKIAMIPAFIIAYYYGLFWFVIALAVVSIISLMVNMWGVKRTISLSISKQLKHILPELLLLACSTLLVFYLSSLYRSDFRIQNIAITTLIYLSIMFGYHLFNQSSLYMNARKAVKYLTNKR